MSFNRRDVLKGAIATISAIPLAEIMKKTQGFGNKPFYFDGLSFLPDDLKDIKASKLDGFIADISDFEEIKLPDGRTAYKRTYEACIKSIKHAHEIVMDPHNNLHLAQRSDNLKEIKLKGKTSVFFQIQGAECIEKDITQLEEFTDLGLTVLQLTHHNGNRFSGGALDKIDTGLTKDGFELISLLNKKNVLIDVSHASTLSALDAIHCSKKPVTLSHGAARKIVPHARCSPDKVIRSLGEKGGVFGVFMMSFWLTQDKIPTTRHYLDQIRYVANIGGIESVGIANDFPMRGQKNLLSLKNNNEKGVAQYLPWWNNQKDLGILGFDHIPTHVVIPEFNTINRMELIDQLLKSSNFKSSEREKIMGKNWSRILTT